jgi:hypothetical protein
MTSKLLMASLSPIIVVMLLSTGLYAGDGGAADARFQSPEAKEWLADHIGVVVRDVDVAGVKGIFDEWAGFVDGKLFDVTAGYEFIDPLAGEMFVSDRNASLGTLYETPVRAGPITIEGEHNGILILKTVPGRFEGIKDYDSHQANFVTVVEVKRFYFDLRTRRFINP